MAPLVIDLAGDSWRIPTAGDVLEAAPIRLLRPSTTRRPRRRPTPPAIPPGPRLERLRELAAEVIVRGEVDSDQAGILGARWLGWRPERIAQPAVVAGDAAELAALRSKTWAEVRDWRAVRYSQPSPRARDDGSSVRDSSRPDPDDGT